MKYCVKVMIASFVLCGSSCNTGPIREEKGDNAHFKALELSFAEDQLKELKDIRRQLVTVISVYYYVNQKWPSSISDLETFSGRQFKTDLSTLWKNYADYVIAVTNEGDLDVNGIQNHILVKKPSTCSNGISAVQSGSWICDSHFEGADRGGRAGIPQKAPIKADAK